VNGLYRVAAVGSLIVGALFLAGAAGHSVATWDRLIAPSDTRLTLLMPALVLAVGGAIDVSVVLGLWRERRWAMSLALVVNVASAAYFGWLLHARTDDHPFGLFLVTACAQVVLLGVAGAGLTWPHPRTIRD
jgi:uncharacterized membrane protein